MALHTTTRATPKYLLIATQRSEVGKEDDELNIVCTRGSHE